MRQTKHRTAIMELLQHSQEALSAQQIHTALPHINLVTIYRNVEHFVTAGTIKKLNFPGNEATFEYQKHHHHHVICDECHAVQHITIDEEKLKDALRLTNFDINDIDIMVHGRCQKKHRLSAS